MKLLLKALLIAVLCVGSVIAQRTEVLRVPQVIVNLADDGDDERPTPRPGRDDDPAPRGGILARIASELRIGHIWSVQQSQRVISLRVSIEYQGRTVSAMTLHPKSGVPLKLGSRVAAPSATRYSSAQLRAILAALRASSRNALRLGGFATASERGARVPLYWNGALSAYVYVNAISNDVLTDTAVVIEIRASPQRER